MADNLGREPAAYGSWRDTIRWGPIIAGLVVTAVALVLLAVLGVAAGLTAEPAIAGEIDVGTAAWIWGLMTLVIAFLIGGFVAAWVTTSDMGTGIFNGFMVGALAIALIMVSAALGIGNVLGVVGGNIEQFADIVTGAETDEALAEAQAQFLDAEGVAWATFAGLAAALVLSAVGGALGTLASRDDARRRTVVR